MVELTSHGRTQQQLTAAELPRGRRSDPTDLRQADTRQSIVLLVDHEYCVSTEIYRGSLAREEEMETSMRSSRRSDNTVTGRLVDSSGSTGTASVRMSSYERPSTVSGANPMNQSAHAPRTTASSATTRQAASTHGYRPSARDQQHIAQFQRRGSPQRRGSNTGTL